MSRIETFHAAAVYQLFVPALWQLSYQRSPPLNTISVFGISTASQIASTQVDVRKYVEYTPIHPQVGSANSLTSYVWLDTRGLGVQITGSTVSI